MKLARILAPSLTLIAGATSVAMIYIDYHHRPRLVHPPRVQMLTAESFSLVFRVHPATPITVEVTPADGQSAAREFSAVNVANDYTASITGLAPGQYYHYQIVAYSEAQTRLVLKQGRTRTAPPAEGAFRALVFGDSGSGLSAQWKLARLIPGMDPDLILHTGDVVYDDGATEDFYWKLYMPYADLMARAAFYPVLGNHDVRTNDGQPLLDACILPENGPPGQQNERNYWFDFGCARFVAIDSNRDLPHYRDVIAPWLDEVLSTAGDRWKILYWHEPIFTSGHYLPATKLLEPLVPIIDRHGVHLVCHGHNHMYERTRPLRGGQIMPDGHGSVYISSGAGGARLYDVKLPLPAYIARIYSDMHSFTVLDVAADRIVIRQMAIDRQVIDTAQISRVPASQPAA